MTLAINAEDLTAYAASLVSMDADAPALECDRCGEQVDTCLDAHYPEDAEAAVFRFLEHTAFDHGSPATILLVTRSRLARVVTASFPDLRFEESVWVAPVAPVNGAAADWERVTKTQPRCCDGTGWTGDPRERCTTHYQPLDGVWFGR